MIEKKPKYGHPAFLEYAQNIVNHPNYAGMPDPYGNQGQIQWEAPSNRASGQFKDTHHLRREWWRAKAISLSIDPRFNTTWISQAAKLNHPYGEKPCKNCGLVLTIAYCYPNSHLINKLRKLSYIDDSFETSNTEHICDLISRMQAHYGDKIFKDLPSLLSTASISVEKTFQDLNSWNKYIAEIYIPQEPRMLSPGAMSNPPDRFDGFHSFNRCCRSTADKGRTQQNLRSYSTDRRVFEYWVDGDWIAADRLMSQVRSNDAFINEACFNNQQGGSHPTPCQADHIGPISLGFTHRPEFQLLCRTCNSGKNNRMYASDIQLLRSAEDRNEQVISWFAKEIWDRRKGYATSTETALRLSKLLRDNRHTYMSLLEKIMESGHLVYLAKLLHLEKAKFSVEFTGLRTEANLTKFDEITHTIRATKYTLEQQFRRIRIAFTSLADYHKKVNRSSFIINNPTIFNEINTGLQRLDSIKTITEPYNNMLKTILDGSASVTQEQLHELISGISKIEFPSINSHFEQAMKEVGKELDSLWGADRYVRAAPEDLIE